MQTLNRSKNAGKNFILSLRIFFRRKATENIFAIQLIFAGKSVPLRMTGLDHGRKICSQYCNFFHVVSSDIEFDALRER